MTSLRSYNDLAALEANRRGLERVIQASGAVFQIADLGRFIQGVMEQLVALLHLGSDAIFLGCDCLALENKEEHFEVLAATGQLSVLKGDSDPRAHLDARIGALLDEALAQKRSNDRDSKSLSGGSPDAAAEGDQRVHLFHCMAFPKPLRLVSEAHWQLLYHPLQ